MTQQADARYQQALDYWFSSINYEQRIPEPQDLKLDRMRALLERLGNPQDACASFTSPGARARDRRPRCWRLFSAGPVTGPDYSLLPICAALRNDFKSMGRSFPRKS